MRNIALKDFAAQYRALADPTRLRLLYLISRAGEVRVSELSAALHLPQSTTSRQLALLRSGGLLLDRREGTSVWYSINNSGMNASLNLLSSLTAVAEQCAELRADLRRLERLRGNLNKE